MKTLPTLDEGFSRVTICANDVDCGMALKLYSNWGGDSQLEDGLYSGSTSNKCSVNPRAKRKAPDDLENGTKAENEGGFSRATRPRGNVDPNDNWADRLHFITEDPDKFPDQVLDYDSVAVVVKDLFPKVISQLPAFDEKILEFFETLCLSGRKAYSYIGPVRCPWDFESWKGTSSHVGAHAFSGC